MSKDRFSDKFKGTFLEKYVKQAQEYDDKMGYGDRDRLGSTFLAPLDLDIYAKQVIDTMRGTCYIQAPDGTMVSVPKYGMYTLMLRSTQLFVYGLPALKKMCPTAFTDGVNMYIADTFLDKLNDSVFDNPSTVGLPFVILHEQDHKYKDHLRRYEGRDPKLANIATDLVNNVGLQIGFPGEKPCPFLSETGYGFAPGDKEAYRDMSEGAVLDKLEREAALEKSRRKEKGGSGGSGGSGNSNGSAGSGGGGGDSYSDPMQEKDPLSQNDPLNPDGEWDPTEMEGYDEPERHFISQEELAGILKDIGMEEHLERLGLPDPDAEDAEEKYEENIERAKRFDRDAIFEAAELRRKYGDKFPGAHLVDAAVEMLSDFDKGVLKWKLKVRDIVMGYSPRTALSFEEPNDLYYCDLAPVLGSDLYLPGNVNVKSNDVVVGVVDTSGSMGKADVIEGVSELIALQGESKGKGDRAARVIIITADTALRGDPIEITAANKDDFFKNGLEIAGRGGTDIDACLNQLIEHPMMVGKNLRSVVYITDTLDEPVRVKPKKLEKMKNAKVAFLAVSSIPLQYVEQFARGTTWADTIQIGAGKTVDLDAEVGLNKDAVVKHKRKTG